jgi:hypothetical protein
LLADLSLYSNEADFIQKLLHEKNKPLAVVINSTFRNIDDVLSINNDRFHSYVDSIYPSELEIKDTTESSTSASYLDVLLNIDAGGKLTTQLMTNGMISILPLSTSLILVATSHYHLHMAYIYLSTDSICKGLLYIRSIFKSG